MRNSFLFLAYMLLFPTYMQSQNNTQYSYKWFDRIIGLENTNIINGIEFKEEFKTLNNNNQYLISALFKQGNLTYNGQAFYDVSLKYDIFSDDIIMRNIDKNGYFAITLIKELVNGFEINDNKFINSNTLQIRINHSGAHGFYDVLYETDYISLFKKHKKFKQEEKNNEFVYVKFNTETKFLIYFNKEIYHIKSKKSLLNIFPAHLETINSYYEKNKVLIDYNYDKFLIDLITELNQQKILASSKHL